MCNGTAVLTCSASSLLFAACLSSSRLAKLETPSLSLSSAAARALCMSQTVVNQHCLPASSCSLCTRDLEGPALVFAVLLPHTQTAHASLALP